MDKARTVFRIGEDRRTEVPVHAAIAGRYSTRAFSDRALGVEQLTLLLEAARWAPSAFNEQPWRFVIGHAGDTTHAALVKSLHPFNRVWAEHAPILILAVAKELLSRNAQANSYARYDLGSAVAMLTVQATTMGIGMHQMAGFDSEEARAAFGLADDSDPVVIIALGYPGEGDYLTETLAAREAARTERKPLDALILR